jgi:hypothetical protein
LFVSTANQARGAPTQQRRTTTGFADTLEHVPEQVWTPAYDGDCRVREGVHVAEVTDLLDPKN